MSHFHIHCEIKGGIKIEETKSRGPGDRFKGLALDKLVLPTDPLVASFIGTFRA